MKRLLLLCLVLYWCGRANGQTDNIKFNLIEGNNGEPLGQINAITQDPNGYMWFNGQGANCLYRYDGIKMTSYKPDNLHPGLQFGVVQETIYADTTGMIWVGFLWGGMELLNPATGVFKHYVHDSADAGSLSAGAISAILRDHLGRLWIGTANGLDRLDEKTGKFIHYRNNPKDPTSLSCDVVRSLYEDREGVLWVGTGFEFPGDFFGKHISEEEGGLNRMEKDGRFTRFMHDPKNPESLINNKVRAIFEDSRGTFWIGTVGDGLHTMNRQKGTFERHTYNPANPNALSRPALKQDGSPDPITFIKEDAASAIWIGTYGSGINRYDPNTKKITHYESSNGYPDKSCWTAFKSRDGALWLSSTDQGGFLFRVNADVNRLKDISNNKSRNINCIYEDEQGTLWASGYATGLLQYDKNKNLQQQFEFDASDSVDLLHNNINAIFQDQPDTLWLCLNDGIALFNKKTKHFSFLRYRPTPNSPVKKFLFQNVAGLVKDNTGAMWAASANELIKYDTKTQSINQYPCYSNDIAASQGDMITSVLSSSSDDIWSSVGNQTPLVNAQAIATRNNHWGINRLDKKTGSFIHYLDSINILCMYKDGKGNIWAGSAGYGLYFFNEKNNRFDQVFDVQSEIIKEPIVNMIEDDQKNLWVITNSSIVRLNPDRKHYFIYGKKLGIRVNTLRFGGLCKTKSDEILVGNNNGFYVFPANEMNEQSKPLQLLVTNLSINNKQVFAANESVLTEPIENTGKISLSHDQNIFSFNFAAIDYREPETNKYYTLLENFDSVWRDAATDKSATYINVPPGHYVFRVKAINIDGVKAEKSIQIIIRPPWWKTTAAYAAYIICFLMISFFANRIIRNRIIEKERTKTREKELLHAKEIEKAYNELKTTQAQLIQSEKMASLGELTAGIAHEIQNPLNFVNNFSEVNAELLEELKAERQKAEAERNIVLENEILNDIEENEKKINHHGKRADAIVKGMLQHSRSSTGVKEPTNINALADEYLRLAYHGLRAKDKDFNATLKTDFDESIGNINIVPQDIGRVLLNLYTNAFYAVNERRKLLVVSYEPLVSVSTKKLGNQILISVSDNGNGIPQKIVDKIFQPFFTTKPTGQGTGLGLSLSYDIIKAHGGEIKVETKEGEGTMFIIQVQSV